MKLRFNLDELIPAIAKELATAHNLVEVRTMTWESKNSRDFFSQKRGLVKGTTAPAIASIQGVRYIKQEKGHTIFYDEESLDLQPLHWCQADIQHLFNGFDYRIIPKKQMLLQLHVSNNGIVRYVTRYKQIRTLSIRNMVALQQFLPRQQIIQLLTLLSHQQWVEELLLRQKEGGHLPLANNLVRTSSSLQAFITKINPTAHKISAKKLKDLDAMTLLEVMRLASRLHNPHTLLENVPAYLKERRENTEIHIMLEDYVRMAVKHGNKVWYTLNPEGLRRHHDKAVLRELETAPIEPITISPVGYLFKTYFPGKHYELIDDGARLKKESILQRHCVSYYSYTINRHRCLIISIVYQGARYTAELLILKGSDATVRLDVNQLRGFANRDAPAALHTELQQLVYAFNKMGFALKDIENKVRSTDQASSATPISPTSVYHGTP